MEAFLNLIPVTVRCAFEFRSQTWLEAGVAELLRARGHSLCTADSDDNPAQELVSTSSWGYLRLRRSGYTEADLKQWAQRIGSQQWGRAFVFFRHEDEATGPAEALHFQELAAQYTQALT